LNYTPGVGRTDGERIEGGWHEAKQAGGMTKEMNTGHRHDTLSDFQNHWNWIKATNIGTFFIYCLQEILFIVVTSSIPFFTFIKGTDNSASQMGPLLWAQYTQWTGKSYSVVKSFTRTREFEM